MRIMVKPISREGKKTPIVRHNKMKHQLNVIKKGFNDKGGNYYKSTIPSVKEKFLKHSDVTKKKNGIR